MVDPVSGGIFLVALYKALETIWEKAFDAAWEPVGEALKDRFTMLAGKDKTTQRWQAFQRAHESARAQTIRLAPNRAEAERIFQVLDGRLDRSAARDLASEAAKLLLTSAEPDLPRMTQIVGRTLKWEAQFTDEKPPAADDVALVLREYLSNLREALLDQEAYHDLVEKDMRRALREIVKELRPVGYDSEDTYRHQLAETHRNLEFVGIPEIKERRPITVEDIFVRLRAQREAPEDERELAEAYLRAEGEVNEEALAALRSARRAAVPGGPLPDRAPVQDILRSAQKVVILGDPGAGKTTVLKYLAVICAEERSEKELGLRADGAGSPLPVFIPLREFAAECAQRNCDYALLDYLYTYAREHLMLNLSRDFFEDALERGRCLVLLDGLDEVWAVGQRKQVVDAVQALATRFPRNRYVVTSRLVGYDAAPLDRRQWAHHTILPLEDDDIREFVRKWYAIRERDPMERKRKTDDLIATIMDREPRIKTLARNPLLLTIIALVHRIEAQLPHERVKLYDKCVTALIDTWDQVKNLTMEEKQRPFYTYRRRLLERLAYTLHTGPGEFGQLRTIREGDLGREVARFLMENRRLGFADDPDGATEEARAFINLVRGRTGLLVEKGEGIFGFPHLTFQEYLAACDIEKRCMQGGVDAIWDAIKDRLMDAHWREVILLLLGSLNAYEDMPTLLVRRVLEAGEGDKYEPVLHRHLYLAARILADRVLVDGALHRWIVDQALAIARRAPQWEATDALSALSRLAGDAYAADGLLALARDPEVDAWVRRAAALALGQLGQADERVLDGLLALARDPEVRDFVRSAAAWALGQLGHAEEAADILLAVARDPEVDAGVRSAAAEALGQLGQADERVLDGLLALARDPEVHAWVRSAAALALGQLGQADERALDGLLALARDPEVHAWGRDAAAWALGQLGQADERVLDGLLALARDPEVGALVRSAAAEALGQLGQADERVLDGLLALARDPEVGADVRRAAAEALGQLGRAQEAADILLALARDPEVDAWVRRAAALALGQLGRAQEAADILLALARDPEVGAGVRGAAARALGQLGQADERVLDGLLALARDPEVDADVRRAAYESLKRLVGGVEFPSP